MEIVQALAGIYSNEADDTLLGCPGLFAYRFG